MSDHTGHVHTVDGPDGALSWTLAVRTLRNVSAITVPEGASAMTVQVD